MEICYDAQYNEIMISTKIYLDINKSSLNFATSKRTYPLGKLLIDFIELNHDEIINMIDNEFKITQKGNSIDFLSIQEICNKLIHIHPYFNDFAFEKIKNECDKYITMYNEYMKLINNSGTNSLQNDYEETLNNSYWCISVINDIVDDYKKSLISSVESGKKYKSAVKYCLDSDNSKFKNLTALQRLYLFNPLKLKETLSMHVTVGEQNYIPGRIDDNLNSDEINKIIPSKSLRLFENYETNINGACYLEFIKLISNNIFVRSCNNCEKYFINTGRADTLYCDRIFDEAGRTCKDVGAMNTYRENVKNDPIMELYQKFYKKNYARTKYKSESKKISKSDFEIWSREAMAMRDKAKLGLISYDEFKNWLNQN